MTDSEFVKAKNFVLHVKTINDTAERAVKLPYEYVNILTKNRKIFLYFLIFYI